MIGLRCDQNNILGITKTCNWNLFLRDNDFLYSLLAHVSL